MKTYTFRGLNAAGETVLAGGFQALGLREARRVASSVRRCFFGLQIWDGAVCIFRSRRRRSAPSDMPPAVAARYQIIGWLLQDRKRRFMAAERR